MKVKELIEWLEEFDSDLDVVILENPDLGIYSSQINLIKSTDGDLIIE